MKSKSQLSDCSRFTVRVSVAAFLFLLLDARSYAVTLTPAQEETFRVLVESNREITLTSQQEETVKVLLETNRQVGMFHLGQISKISALHVLDAIRLLAKTPNRIVLEECVTLQSFQVSLLKKMLHIRHSYGAPETIKQILSIENQEQADVLEEMLEYGYLLENNYLSSVTQLTQKTHWLAAQIYARTRKTMDFSDVAKLKEYHLTLLKKLVQNSSTDKFALRDLLKVQTQEQSDILISMVELRYDFSLLLSDVSLIVTPEALKAVKISLDRRADDIDFISLSRIKKHQLPLLEKKLIESSGKGARQILAEILRSAPPSEKAERDITDRRVDLAQLNKTRAELNQMVGLSAVKQEVNNLVKVSETNKIRKELGIPETQLLRHYIFTGPPGTGKTTGARLVGKILKNLGVLSKGDLVEVGQADLVGGYRNETAGKTAAVIEKARGGILFIDEAYSLMGEGNHRGRGGNQAIDTLVQLSENYRDDLVIILAGYHNKMLEFLEYNPGLLSRFSGRIHFKDYENKELAQIALNLLQQDETQVSSEAQSMITSYFNALEPGKDLGNARFVRNLVDKIGVAQSKRISDYIESSKLKAPFSSKDRAILRKMFREVLADDVRLLDDGFNGRQINEELLNSALSELDALEGLEEIKQKVNELIAFVKIGNKKREMGLALPKISNHLLFVGPPGTGKTTVARIFGKIYRALNLVSIGNVFELGRSDLIAEYLGQTAVKVKAQVAQAIGGVIFIDEAYSLFGGKHDSFGREAVSTFLKEIEDNNHDLVVILAGYSREMEELMASNSGLRSRFSTQVNFQGFTREGLENIMRRLARKEGLVFYIDAQKEMKYWMDQIPEDRWKAGYARLVRNWMESIQTKQALRLQNTPGVDLDNKEVLQRVTAEDVRLAAEETFNVK